MADEPQERRWVVEPPGPGEIKLHFATGDDVELTDEQLDALAKLIHSFESEEPEVVGHACGSWTCGLCKDCSPLNCSPVSCTGLSCPSMTGVVGRGGAYLSGSIMPSPRI